MKFTGEILAGGGGGHAVLVPAEVVAGFSRKNARVRAVVNGIEYESRIARYGGKSYLGLRKDLLRSIGVDTGDPVEIELTEMAEPAPEPESEPTETAELTTALGDGDLRTAFEAMPPEHRREYVRWIEGGESAAIRTERAAKLVRRLERLSPPPPS